MDPNPSETMTTAVRQHPTADAIELALVQGDLAKLTPEQRVTYYHRVCESLALNPLTKPFDYLNLNGKLVLYARKDCTEQLRRVQKLSVKILAREVVEGCYVVTARAATHDGREDESVGAVNIDGLKGEARANAMMKAETKAKRRVTLSICGLGMLDETEVETIPGAAAFSDHPVAAITHATSEETESALRDHAKAIEDAETLEELKAAFFVAYRDNRLTPDEKTRLAQLKDERKVALTTEPGEAFPPNTDSSDDTSALRV